MIAVKFDDEAALRDIRARLGDIQKKAPNILRNALDATSRQAKKELSEKGAKAYEGHTKKDFSNAMPILRPTKDNLSAVIRVKGQMEELTSFNTVTTEDGIIKAKVLKNSTLKEIVKGNIKAFGIRFDSGHESIAQRKGDGRLPVKKLVGPSIPHMVENERVMDEDIEEKTITMLWEQINKRIAKALEKGTTA